MSITLEILYKICKFHNSRLLNSNTNFITYSFTEGLKCSEEPSSSELTEEDLGEPLFVCENHPDWDYEYDEMAFNVDSTGKPNFELLEFTKRVRCMARLHGGAVGETWTHGDVSGVVREYSKTDWADPSKYYSSVKNYNPFIYFDTFTLLKS